MPTIQVEAELSYETLLKAVVQLTPEELGKLQAEMQALQARRRAIKSTSSAPVAVDTLQRLNSLRRKPPYS